MAQGRAISEWGLGCHHIGLMVVHLWLLIIGKLAYCYYIYTDNIIAYIYIKLMLKHLLKPMSIYFKSHLTFMSLVLRNGTGYCHWKINRKGVSWLKREINVSMISCLFAFIFCYTFPLSYKTHSNIFCFFPLQTHSKTNELKLIVFLIKRESEFLELIQKNNWCSNLFIYLLFMGVPWSDQI